MNSDKTVSEQLAQYFKYLQQFNRDYITQKLEIRRVPWKTTYSKYKRQFDKLAAIFQKYNLDAFKYVEFFVKQLKKSEYQIKSELVNMSTFDQFQDFLVIEEKRKRAYESFQRSIENIADDCIALNILTVKDYIRYIIRTGKIGSYYLTGRISRYWFAGIPSFKKIAAKADSLSRDELADVINMFDIYSGEINEAFMMIKHCKANPIKMTDERIFAKRNLPQSK